MKGGSQYSDAVARDMEDVVREPHPIGYDDEGRTPIQHRLVTADEMRDLYHRLKKIKESRPEKKLSAMGKLLRIMPEMHLIDLGTMKRHNFTGPGTNLMKRLEKGTVPIDMVDQYAMFHDINYGLLDSKERHKADKILMDQMDKVLEDPNSTKSTKFNAYLVKNVFKHLSKIGAGLGRILHFEELPQLHQYIITSLNNIIHTAPTINDTENLDILIGISNYMQQLAQINNYDVTGLVALANVALDDKAIELGHQVEPGSPPHTPPPIDGGKIQGNHPVLSGAGQHALETPEIIQSMVFNKNKWNQDQAIQFLEKHNLKHTKIDKTKQALRFRQFNPKQGLKFRTVDMGPGIKDVLNYK